MILLWQHRRDTRGKGKGDSGLRNNILLASESSMSLLPAAELLIVFLLGLVGFPLASIASIGGWLALGFASSWGLLCICDRIVVGRHLESGRIALIARHQRTGSDDAQVQVWIVELRLRNCLSFSSFLIAKHN